MGDVPVTDRQGNPSNPAPFELVYPAIVPVSISGTFGGHNVGAAVGTLFYDGAAGTPILNIVGNGRQWTGVNPSGSIYAGQMDIASVGGAAVANGVVPSALFDVNGNSFGSFFVSGSHYLAVQPINAQVFGSSAGSWGTAVSLNVGGTEREWTGVNPSGTIYAAQVAGVASATGAYSFNNITTATTTTAKAGAGTFAGLAVNTKGSGSTATIYDNTAGTGAKIATVDTGTALGTIVYNVAFSTGLTIVTVGTADITVIFK